jgi:hypothetical protein
VMAAVGLCASKQTGSYAFVTLGGLLSPGWYFDEPQVTPSWQFAMFAASFKVSDLLFLLERKPPCGTPSGATKLQACN